MASEKLVPYKPQNTTLYVGAGRGFAPGSEAALPERHAAEHSAHESAIARRLAQKASEPVLDAKTEIATETKKKS